VLTTDLPGNWGYSRCLAYVYFTFLSLCNPEAHSDSESRALFGFFLIRSYSHTTIRPKTVLHNAQPSVIRRQAWKLPMSAVCVLLQRSVFYVSRKYHLIGCGDVEDITSNGGTTAPETDCTVACSGDPLHLCGGAQRLQLYLWNGTLNNWQMPANIGQYEVRTKCPFLYMDLRATMLLTVVSRSWPRTPAARHRRYKWQGFFPRERWHV
jgi:hypothetical protein